MADREAILARFAAIVDAVALADGGSSGRNLPRTDDDNLPCYSMFDGEEEANDNPLSTGTAPNVVTATTEVVITLMDDVDAIGASANAKLKALQKAILQDSELVTLCRGFRPAGPRYLGASFSVTDEARKATAEMTARFSIAYPFKPGSF